MRAIVAEILKPRGNRGELAARSQTDVPGRLQSLQTATVRFADGTERPVEITEAWEHKGDWVIKFAGVDTIDTAHAFRGAELWAERAELPAGEMFESDVVGCAVIHRATGEELGKVEEIARYGGPPLLVLTAKGREVLIPFVPEICDVDVKARQVRVTPPEGLLDL